MVARQKIPAYDNFLATPEVRNGSLSRNLKCKLYGIGALSIYLPYDAEAKYLLSGVGVSKRACIAVASLKYQSFAIVLQNRYLRGVMVHFIARRRR